jgi:Na+-driven multidrug efflux pump
MMIYNAKMAGHGDLQLAAMGITQKIERLSNSIALGISQGMLPLVAYNYATRNVKRMKAFVRTARLAGLVVAAISITFYQLMAKTLIELFISNKGNAAAVATTIALGITFLRIRSLAAPFNLLNFVATTGIQAMGDGKLSMLQVFIRQILLSIPGIYLLNHFFGLMGLIWTFVVTEGISSIISTYLIHRKLKKVEAQFAAGEVPEVAQNT